LTPATWMRQYVRAHPEYKNDSVVSPKITSDLLREIDDVVHGRRVCHALLGDFIRSRPPGIGAPTQPPTGAADVTTPGADAELLHRTPARRLRGASFAEEAGDPECFVIK